MKKKIPLILLMTMIVGYGFSQPVFSVPTYPASVDLFDLFEVSLTMGNIYSNPYDPTVISMYAIFTSPDNTTYKVDAFYYEEYSFYEQDGYEHAVLNTNNLGYSWKIRFTPNCVGTWRFKIIATDIGGTTQKPNPWNSPYSFVCNSVNDAVGFISKANNRYLKRDVVINGVRQFHSFFPIGPDVGWYDNKNNDTTKPYGIYQYEDYIDSLYGNCNYMRVWLTRYQHLSLYGPEYTQTESGHTKVYFDSVLNQKDSAELDYIITYASQHGINMMLCMFTHGDFRDKTVDPSSKSKWENNPFNTILGLESACCIFTNEDAKRITKNLFRYIVSRWGYATNIVAWEFWNEVDNMFYMCEGYKQIEQDVLEWHEEMEEYIREIDPFNHLVTTSSGGTNNVILFPALFDYLDFVQAHDYQNIQNAESRHQLLYRLYNKTMVCQNIYPTKPFLMGEFGFDQGPNVPEYVVKDPYGIDLHNSLWSSLFFTSIGSASFWWWPYVNTCGLYNRFAPLLNFSQNMPIPSESFTAHHKGSLVGHKLVFENALQTYYMINATEDTIYGWSQDTAFAYQSLRWLTDGVHIVQTQWGPVRQFKDDDVYDPLGYVYTLNQSKKPAPSSNSNTIKIPIANQPVGASYKVKWYDSETGLPYGSGNVPSPVVYVQQELSGRKFISFEFPSYIRNLQQHVINNNFGDAVFFIYRYQDIEMPY